jgi:hypothetical protein
VSDLRPCPYPAALYFKLGIRCNETRGQQTSRRSLLFLITYLGLHSKQIGKPRFAVLIGIACFYIDTTRCLPVYRNTSCESDIVLQGSSTRGTRTTSSFCVAPKIPTNAFLFFYTRSRDSSVGIVIHGLWAGWPGFDSRQGKEFTLLHSFQTGSGSHPASYSMGTGGDFPEGKAAGA